MVGPVRSTVLALLVLATSPPPDTGAAEAATAVSGAPTLAGADAGEGYRSPLTGPLVVLTPFDPPQQRWGRGHRGVDLAAEPGSTVLAAGAGVVVFAGRLAGRGVVSIQHPSGLRTTYEPVTAAVGAGDRVRAGQPIGVLQSGHASCAPRGCLHWGARRGADDYVDPMLLITPVRIRLEPWEG